MCFHAILLLLLGQNDVILVDRVSANLRRISDQSHLKVRRSSQQPTPAASHSTTDHTVLSPRGQGRHTLVMISGRLSGMDSEVLVASTFDAVMFLWTARHPPASNRSGDVLTITVAVTSDDVGARRPVCRSSCLPALSIATLFGRLFEEVVRRNVEAYKSS